MGSETLLVITPFTPAQAWIDDLRKRVPGINVHVHPTEMYAKEIPNDVPFGKTPRRYIRGKPSLP
jgi:hypothetical protein